MVWRGFDLRQGKNWCHDLHPQPPISLQMAKSLLAYFVFVINSLVALIGDGATACAGANPCCAQP